jgi:endonuclease I
MRRRSFVWAVCNTSTDRSAFISSNCLTLKKKAKLFSETSICTLATTQCHILEDRSNQLYCSDNLKIRETILIARIKNLYFKWLKCQERNRNTEKFHFIIFWNNMERGRAASFRHGSTILRADFVEVVG